MKVSLATLTVLLTLRLAVAASWSGTYAFSEHAPPDETWVYKLHIDGNNARLDINGFQTMLAYACLVQSNGNGIDIIYRDTLSKGSPSRYARGAVLFSLRRGLGGGLVTKWGALQPQLPSSARRETAFKRQ